MSHHHIGHDKDWLEQLGPRWQEIPTMTVLRPPIKGQKVSCSPIPENPQPFSQNNWNNLPTY